MFAGRAAGASVAGKGGKYTVEELYGFNKKPKTSGSVLAKLGTRGRAGQGQGPKDESGALASQILEAARRLMERRRLDLYLRECGLSLADCAANQTAMTYR
ncbi:hypothetical protein AAFF_G00156560 [Aldrovandia affinis]|uniref:Uncharacterized protein n=1 Tax=Aldrovandia affinis TaxID=143900 RepID=A0AAD7W8J1_9TELE|nr:hypothetical protein AAFF_G00156560 [Aldrovandia affinis]